MTEAKTMADGLARVRDSGIRTHGGLSLDPRLDLSGSSGPGHLLAGDSLSPFPPIAEYGFLSDCETTALVAPSGNVEWLCLPRLDSPSVFGALLDRDAGTFRFGPEGVEVPADRRYLPGTMVLETSWDAQGGWII